MMRLSKSIKVNRAMRNFHKLETDLGPRIFYSNQKIKMVDLMKMIWRTQIKLERLKQFFIKNAKAKRKKMSRKIMSWLIRRGLKVFYNQVFGTQNLK